jgi:hypothetical protein
MQAGIKQEFAAHTLAMLDFPNFGRWVAAGQALDP